MKAKGDNYSNKIDFNPLHLQKGSIELAPGGCSGKAPWTLHIVSDNGCEQDVHVPANSNLAFLHTSVLDILGHTGGQVSTEQRYGLEAADQQRFLIKLAVDDCDLSALNPSILLCKAGVRDGSTVNASKLFGHETASPAVLHGSVRKAHHEMYEAHHSKLPRQRPSKEELGSLRVEQGVEVLNASEDYVADTEVVDAIAANSLFIVKTMGDEEKNRLVMECANIKQAIRATQYKCTDAVLLAKSAAERRMQRDLRTTGGRFRRALARIKRSRVRGRLLSMRLPKTIWEEGKDPAKHWATPQGERLADEAALYAGFAREKTLDERVQQQKLRHRQSITEKARRLQNRNDKVKALRAQGQKKRRRRKRKAPEPNVAPASLGDSLKCFLAESEFSLQKTYFAT